jgi:fatty-acyl-CoA synthase
MRILLHEADRTSDQRIEPMMAANVETIAAPESRERSGSKAWLRALERTAPISHRPLHTFPNVIEALAAQFGNAPALIAESETLSFRALNERANRYARWALAQGLNCGETVGLLMLNRPEYMAVWLGVTRVGAVAALLNTHLAGQSLAHCIDIVAPKHMIVASEVAAF